MFKRFSKDDQSFLLPPSSAPSPALLKKSPRTSPSLPPPQLSPASTGASYPFPYTPAPPSPSAPPVSRSIDRSTLHKTLASLSTLLVALDELRETTTARAKAQKKVAKAVRELAGGFSDKAAGEGGKSEVIVRALQGAEGMLDALDDTKYAKGLEKDYEGLNGLVEKYFKKTAKEEKAYDEVLAKLDTQVAKATSSYQSSSASSSNSRNPHAALNSLTTQHTAYMTMLSSLSAQVQHTKASYAEAIAGKRENAVRDVAQTVAGMAEKEWRNRVEGTKRGGAEVGKLISGAMWCEAGMEEGGAAAFPAVQAKEDGPSTQHLAPTPASSVPTNDVSPPMRQGYFSPPPQQRDHALRGPRAPSSSTVNTTTSTSQPSILSYDSSFLSAIPFRSTVLSDHQAAPNPPPPSFPSVTFASSTRPPAERRNSLQPLPSPTPVPSNPSRQSFDAPRDSPADKGDNEGLPRRADDVPPVSTSQEPLRGPLPAPIEPTHAFSSPPPTAPPDVLRRPTPRYGSAPSYNTASGAVDEFGRARENSSRPGVQREDSFVGKMAEKWGSATVGAGGEERERQMSSQSAAPTLTHARASSRVQLLTKRFSAPPEPLSTYPSTSSSFRALSPDDGVTSPTSPIMTALRRPLPTPVPTTGHRSSSSQQLSTSFSSSSSAAYDAPNRPQFGTSSSYGPPPVAAVPLPSQPSSGGRSSEDYRRRPRAYETASPLPPAEEDEEEWRGTMRSSQRLPPPPPASSSSFDQQQHPTYSPRLLTSPQPTPIAPSSSSSSYPATFSPLSPSFNPPPNSHTASVIDSSGLTHSRLCGCAQCAAVKYGKGSGSGGQGKGGEEEEERLQMAGRREREKEGGTWRGILGRAL